MCIVRNTYNFSIHFCSLMRNVFFFLSPYCDCLRSSLQSLTFCCALHFVCACSVHSQQVYQVYPSFVFHKLSVIIHFGFKSVLEYSVFFHFFDCVIFLLFGFYSSLQHSRAMRCPPYIEKRR